MSHAGTRGYCAYRITVCTFSITKHLLKLKCSLQKRHPESVEELHKLLQDIKKYQELKACLSYLANKASSIMSYIDIFQSRRPLTVKKYDHLEDLQILFATNQQLPDESFAQFIDETDEINLLRQRDIRIIFQTAFDGAQDKLQKYMDGAQPGIKFPMQVRIFSPSRVSILLKTKLENTAIPLFTDVLDEEFTKYVEHLAPQAVQRAGGIPIDLDNFWNSVSDSVPTLTNIAKCYVNFVVSSADEERSFSL